MSKGNYTHIQFLETEIVARKASGKTKREIAEHYGLKTEQVKELLKRHRRRERKIIAGIASQRTSTERWTGSASARKSRVGPTANGKQTVAGFSAIDRKEVRAQVKYQVVYMNRNRYPVSVMCRFFGVSRSGYYDYVGRLDQPAHNAGDIYCFAESPCTTRGVGFFVLWDKFRCWGLGGSSTAPDDRV